MERVIEISDLEDARKHVGKKAYAIGATHSHFLQNGKLPKGQDGKDRPLELRSLVEIVGVNRSFGRVRYQVSDSFITVSKEPHNLILIEEE
tara:strand:+ start:272 stop:544 length:273 start_codon:yes stop_codon:yes gene_type:complete